MGQHQQINICIIGIPNKEKGAETLFEEITAENIPNLKKETDIQSRKPKISKLDESKERYNKTHYN